MNLIVLNDLVTGEISIASQETKQERINHILKVIEESLNYLEDASFSFTLNAIPNDSDEHNRYQKLAQKLK